MIGKIISHYKIIEELGRGGMGVVYKAEDTKLRRTVALKFLPPELTRDAEAKQRFLHEAQAAAALNHANIVTIHETNEHEGQVYIVMEYVEGRTLKESISGVGAAPRGRPEPNDDQKKGEHRGSPLPTTQVIDIALQLTSGLAAAHAKGIVHRDVKPANIFITNDHVVKILDFGIAKLAGGQTKLTKTGTTMGTVAYMSPEQAMGKEVDQRSDIWSLGVVLYEMLTGKLPFPGEYEQGIIYAILNENPPTGSLERIGVPSALSKIIVRCLEKDPGKRYQQADEIIADLRAVQQKTTGTINGKKQKLRFALFIAAAAMLLSAFILSYFFLSKNPVTIGDKSIAVLPFVDMSPQKDQDYFCDGMTEELINRLSNVRELRVVARTSAFAFKGKQIDVREVGEKLNADAVLEGSVRKSGQRLRITAQLINVADGYHLWSGQFDREMKDIFDIQEEISLTIADHLKLNLLKGEKEKLLKRHTEDHEAYELYLKGRFFWYRRGEKGFQRGLHFFQQAVEKDPGYAPAYVGIADAFATIGGFSFMPPHQAYAQAKAAAQKALEIDPELAEVYASLGWITMFYDWDWPAAERYFLQAIRMKPDYALAHQWYKNLLLCTGRFDEAIREMEVACRLEPLEPVNPTHLGFALGIARRFDESIETLRKVIESDPEFSLAYWFQSFNFLGKKMWGEAIAMLQKFVELSPGYPGALSTLAFAYGSAGMKDEAFKILERLNELSKDHYVGSLWRALVWLGLGKKNEALENLEKAYQEKESFFIWIKVWHLFDSVRSEPRFQALLKKMNLDKP